MASLNDIPQASLIHSEEPYAAIILKPSRETHCHFCMKELPIDTVPCLSCSIPVYCSQHCQELAGGQVAETGSNTTINDIPQGLPDEIKMYIAGIASPTVAVSYMQHFSEHRHECGGINWPALLPPDIVLAGRILVKTVRQQGHCSLGSVLTGVLGLSHNYANLLPERKLEVHIFAIILLYCLWQSCGSEFPRSGDTVSKFVILLCQIKVNAMAIVQMKSQDPHGATSISGKFSRAGEALTSNVEQVKVGQAVYVVGSLFNHSCQPNIHAYFLSRTLFVRSTEFVKAGCPLELSYGPQVGECDCKKRQEILEDRYSFRCWCSGCSELNLPDLVVNAYQCPKLNCFGVVLDCIVTQYEKQKNFSLHVDHSICVLKTHVQAGKPKYGEFSKMASRLLQPSSSSNVIEPGECLNCGFRCDLEASHATASKAEISIECLQHEIAANEVQSKTLSDALLSLDQLKSTLHSYNKRIAEVEDIIAHGYCLVGKVHLGEEHCKASVEILELLYGHDHIAIGNELLKLSTIQLALGDEAALDSLYRVRAILCRYYGSHTDIVFLYLQDLEKAARELARL